MAQVVEKAGDAPHGQVLIVVVVVQRARKSAEAKIGCLYAQRFISGKIKPYKI